METTSVLITNGLIDTYEYTFESFNRLYELVARIQKRKWKLIDDQTTCGEQSGSFIFHPDKNVLYYCSYLTSSSKYNVYFSLV